MADHINITNAQGKWLVLAAGAVIGESTKALELCEGDYPAVIYFPREDIAMAFLDETETTSHCPWKGDATYFTIQGKSGPITDAAWSYDNPLPGVEPIKGHLAFFTNKVKVQQG